MTSKPKTDSKVKNGERQKNQEIDQRSKDLIARDKILY